MGYPNLDAFGRDFRLDHLRVAAPDPGWERLHHRALGGSPLESPVGQPSVCPSCRVRWPCDTVLAAVLAEQGRDAAMRLGR